MSGFQIVALATLVMLVVVSLTAVASGKVRHRVGLPWTAVWLAAGVAIVWPESTRHLAGLLGIGRGADLVLYSVSLIMMIGFFLTYVRLRRLQANVTILVRHLALKEPWSTGVADPRGAE